ncbi:hypothetical protein AB6A40_010812, partial [Gnathostoma spinigerum]
MPRKRGATKKNVKDSNSSLNSIPTGKKRKAAKEKSEKKEPMRKKTKKTSVENTDPTEMLNGGSKAIKIISWNVAGLKAWIKKGCDKIITREKPDLMLLQETKCTEIPKDLNVDGYKVFLRSSTGKSGHAGVALLSKEEPVEVTYGLGCDEFDGEGRLIFAEFPSFILINSYVPNSGRGLVRLDGRKRWDMLFLEKIQSLDKRKPVIYCGDLNVAHQEIDLANPKSNHNKTAGFTDQERDDFTRLLNAGFVDVFRKLNPEKTGAYTFWSHMHNARASNTGWRLDYFVVSERLMGMVKECKIHSNVQGSDHCP